MKIITITHLCYYYTLILQAAEATRNGKHTDKFETISNTMNIGRVTKKNRSKKSTKKANKKEENKTTSKRYSKCNNKNLYIFPHKVKSMLK